MRPAREGDPPRVTQQPEPWCWDSGARPSSFFAAFLFPRAEGATGSGPVCAGHKSGLVPASVWPVRVVLPLRVESHRLVLDADASVGTWLLSASLPGLRGRVWVVLLLTGGREAHSR